MKKTLYLVCFALVIGCGGSTPPAEEPAAPTEDAVEVAAPQSTPQDWSAMNFEQRKMYMNDQVKPQMGELFLPGHPDFNCPTCHGANFQEVKLKMPNTLAPLDPTNMPFNSADEKIKGAADFMAQKVVPRMAGLLNQEPYNAETKTGFGCFGCHATKI